MIEFRRPGQALLENVRECGGPGGAYKQNQQQKTSIHFSPNSHSLPYPKTDADAATIPRPALQGNALQTFVSI
jgi:hypothetical protein